MSRRQRCAKKNVVRARVAQAKVLRRRAREAGAARAATAATAAALSLAGASASVGYAIPNARAGTLEGAPRTAVASLERCPDPVTDSSVPGEFVEVGGTLFFTADDGIHGLELWKSDGTKAGTVLVRDIRPGTVYDSYYQTTFNWSSRPSYLIAAGGKLYFTADDGIHGTELWKSNGTKAGTALVKDINRFGHHSADPSGLTAVSGKVYFMANDGAHGEELWKSDGTKAGTVLVKDIYRNTDHGSSATYLAAAGGEVFLAAKDGIHGRELWRSDGTRAGTVLVKDIDPDPHQGSQASLLAAVGRTVYFTADDGVHGEELWISDGTNAGTVLVKDVTPGDSGTYFGFVHAATAEGKKLFFKADDNIHGLELWKSNGTNAGTVLVKDIVPGDYYDAPFPQDLTPAGGRLFFTADDGVHGRELWKTSSSNSGTAMVKNIGPRAASGLTYPVVTPLGGKVFFVADDSVHGEELWQTDGSRSGTVLVKDINPCSNQSGALGTFGEASLGRLKGTLFFAGDDGIDGWELWKSDGTRSGTVMVKNINMTKSP
jgi:ELWxxDGT repeat protein